jgi:signal transduction histidine kinase
VTQPATLDGDPLLVERLVANLLTNAVRHNVAGGRVEVRTGVQDGSAVLSVTNTGPPIPPADVDRLFQPFQRLDPRRASYKDGHGLGLSSSGPSRPRTTPPSPPAPGPTAASA